jgi:hypothetical protein
LAEKYLRQRITVKNKEGMKMLHVGDKFVVYKLAGFKKYSGDSSQEYF